MSTTHIELHKTRDFGKKLNATIEFLKENFKPLFKAMLYIAGPALILGSLLFTQLFSGFFRISLNQAQGVDPSMDNMMSMGIYGLAGAIFLLIGGTAVIATVNEYIILYEKKGSSDISVNEVWERVKSSFFTVLGTMILYTVFLIVAYIVILIPVVLLTAISPFLTFLGIMAFVIGVAYVAVTFSLIFIVKAYEKVGFGTAVSRCFQLIKGKWWSTFGLVFVTSIIQSTVSSIFFIPWYANFIIQMLHNAEAQAFEDPSLLFQIINNVTLLLYFVCSYIMYCIPLIAIAFQYFNLVELKEARGLMSKIESFGEDQSQDDEEEHY